MSSEVKVAKIPICDIHRDRPAYADARLPHGIWASVCKACFDRYCCSLGTGQGQEYVL